MPFAGAGVQIKIDYDVQRWALIPPAEVMSHEEWARRTARSWSADLGRAEDHNWPEVLERMLLVTAGAPNEERWDARLVHISARPGEAPQLVPVNLVLSAAADAPDGLPRMLARPQDPGLVEAPIVEAVEMEPGMTATRIIRYVGDTEDTVRIELYFTWRPRPDADLTLFSSMYDLGAVVAIRDELVGLARSVALVPFDDAR